MRNILLPVKLVKLSLIVSMVFLCGCSKKGDLSSLSPMEIVKKSYKASDEGDYELLRQITYFPPGTTEEEINKKIGYSDSNSGAGAKKLMTMMGTKTITRYEKILNEDTAEVGTGMKVGIGPASFFVPLDQEILKKDSGIWKFSYSRAHLTSEQLIEHLRKDPDNTWAYYHLGMSIQSDNRYKANKYYKKYYELNPDGFFVHRGFLEKLEEWGNFEKQERIELGYALSAPPDSGGRVSRYIHLCQLYMEHNKYSQVAEYLEKAEKIVRKKSKFYSSEIAQLAKLKEELRLRMSGEYVDLLDELQR